MKRVVTLNGCKYEVRTYDSKRVLTAGDIKNIKSLSGTSYVTNYIRRGILKEGEDFYKLPWEVYRMYSKGKNKNSSNGSYLITEKGYKVIFKNLDTIDCDIINTYYNDAPKIAKIKEKDEQNNKETENNLLNETDLSSNDKTIELLSDFIKMQSNILQEIKDEHIRFLNGLASMFDKMVETSINIEKNDSSLPTEKSDISDYEHFKKMITQYANKVLSNSSKYKTTNDVLSEAYKRLRDQYGVVWEQEKKDFYNTVGRSPISTLELEWWIEKKPIYKELLIGKLETMSRER